MAQENDQSTSVFTRRHFLATAATLPLVAGSFVSQAFATEGFSASAETEAALADAESRYQAALVDLDYLNNQVFDAEALYSEITMELLETTQQIEDLEASIAQEEIELAEAQDILADRIAANYRAGNLSMLEVLLDAVDFDDFISRVYYANKVADSDAEAIQNVKDIKDALEADEAELLIQQANEEELQAQQAAQVAELNARVAETEAYVNSLDSEVRALMAQRDAEIEAAAEAARIAAEEAAAREAEEEAARQAAAEAEAAAAAEAASYEGNGGGSGDSGGSADSGSSSSGDSGAAASSSSSSASSSSSSNSSSSGYSGTSSSNASLGWQLVQSAEKYIGTLYSVMDCSGLTSTAYGDLGYYLYHQSGVQYNTVVSKGHLVGADQLVAGDLVFYASGGSIYHVGMYVSGDVIIDSIPDGGVQRRTLYNCSGFCGGGSPL